MSSREKKRTILGVDPGTRVTGYGLITEEGAVDFGCIRPPADLKLSDRYWIIYSSLSSLIEKYEPSVVVVETQFVNKNVASAMKLGMARGTVILAAKRYQLPLVEYSPTRAKKAVTGLGSATKGQVQAMVQRLLRLAQPPTPEDAADALALALCHLHTKGVGVGKEI